MNFRFATALSVLCAAGAWLSAQEPPTRPAATPAAVAPPPAPPAGAVPLNREGTIFLDVKAKKLFVRAEVVLREGMLEMLLCRKQTKEHESILAFDGRAYILHAGLVAAGVEPGRPVTFTPEFVPPAGTRLDLAVVWTGEDGQPRREDARRWIRHSIHRYLAAPLPALPAGLTLPSDGNLRYDATNKELSWYGPMTDAQRDELLAFSPDPAYRKAVTSFHERTRSRPMEADWVFAGSGFTTDETSGRKAYLAEAGDVVCVANFPSATIDVASRSSAEGQESLLYEAWTERIPPAGTPVLLEITPAAEQPAEPPAPDPAVAPKPASATD